ncbi:MAG: DNA polymerase III subunit gamma/tau [Actinomycetota bacterium]|nr:DNA polymerase III subunit gamma/tau [Actinomycetota bacterium]
MSAQQSLYRRHRPQSFAQVVGQEHVVRTLSNAIERDRVHHAYLFVGSRGTGKTSIAKILARSLNCVNGPTLEPCGSCEACTSIAAGTSMDVMEMDAASNRSVDDIRELRDRVGFAPAAGKWKVYILDEAHMLTREAWNAFLKTLEEPPPSTVFILATTEPHKVMPTIVDRCQRFDFARPAPEQIAEVLRRVAAAEEIEIADGAIAAVARSASGSFRDALGTLDQLVAYGGKRIETDDVLAVLGVADATLILAAADAIATGNGRATLEASEGLARSGRDVAQFGRDLLAHLRQLLIIRAAAEGFGADGLQAAEPARMEAQAETFTDLGLTRAIDSVAAALTAIREGDEPRMTMELALLRAARPQLDPSREAFAQRLERIESALEGKPAPSVTPPQAAARAAPQASPPKLASSGPAAQQPNPRPPEEEPGRDPQVIASEALNLERLVGLWPAVMDQVKSGSELLSHALSVARPIAVDVEQAVVQVGFPVSAGFNKRKAEAVEARDSLADAVKTIVGERLRPVYVVIEGEEAPPDAPAEAELSPDELFEHMKDAFDGVEFDVGSADGGDAGAASMEAGLDAGPGIDTGEAA